MSLSIIPDEIVHKLADNLVDVRGVMLSCWRYYNLLRLRNDAIVWRLDTKYRLEYLPPKMFYIFKFTDRDVIDYGNVELMRQCVHKISYYNPSTILVGAIRRKNITIFVAVLDSVLGTFDIDPAEKEYGTPYWCTDVILACSRAANVDAFCELYKRFPKWREVMDRYTNLPCAAADAVANYME